jgi:deazaflavin-dependent oxidoreductase (nitroreductase family)
MNPLMKAFLGVNILLFRATSGKIGSSMFGGRVLLLTTRGRKSGKERTVPVMYFEDGPRRVVIASAGGSPTHPAWYTNLRHNPEVTVEEKGRRRYRAHATTATGEERARIWNQVVTEQPRFAEYADKARQREIPVVTLSESAP